MENQAAQGGVAGYLSVAAVAFLLSLIVNAIAKRRIANPSKVTFSAVAVVGLISLGLAGARGAYFFGYEIGQLAAACVVLGIIHHFATRKKEPVSTTGASQESQATNQEFVATRGNEPS